MTGFKRVLQGKSAPEPSPRWDEQAAPVDLQSYLLHRRPPRLGARGIGYGNAGKTVSSL